ncbi:MAG TPA: NADH-quinone oxidoreductase subunit L, partial [Burkholderiales bacterium]|nr:NADH-quinone oxidoreductase subunit L [Burkholderiales bacterium]
MQTLYLIIPLAPLAGALVAGLLCMKISNRAAHSITIFGMLVSTIGAAVVFYDVLQGHTYNGSVYTWLVSGETRYEIGFLIDRLSAIMMLVVAFVSLMVHIYTIGYMRDDPGYNRFFSYISLFTFSMLMLVMANNFLQLFFGWEAVGLVSYLLIGFWYTRPTAIYANLKAFLVNRVGDFGFLLGIALTLMYFGTLDYATVFANAGTLSSNMVEIFPGHAWSLMTVICVLLFVGAMGKSAQFPLHVWLPDSMEGPTPISALIHAATMVTAGIFMVARMSPLFELSETALSFVLVIGAITAFFMALIAMVQYDIKRVIAYSTLSQLGYMTMALGASAYPVAIFHLMTHAFFKAVLFLGAGSVIIALHHEQDMRKMGGLRKYMPVTYLTVLIGAIANAGLPPFSGFFSKDTIIEAVHASHTFGATFAYVAALGAVLAGGFYSFRLVFFAFHGKERFDTHGHSPDGHGGTPHESPLVVTVPLILLAIPSIAAGWVIGDVVFGDYFGASIHIAGSHPGVAELAEEFRGVIPMIVHGLTALPFWLTLAGAVSAWYLYIARPELPALLRRKARFIVTILEEKYGFDRFNDWFFAGGARMLGTGLWQRGDVTVIDGFFVNGPARVVGWLATVVRRIQSGFLYDYAFAMIIGVLLLLSA